VRWQGILGARRENFRDARREIGKRGYDVDRVP